MYKRINNIKNLVIINIIIIITNMGVLKIEIKVIRRSMIIIINIKVPLECQLCMQN